MAPRLKLRIALLLLAVLAFGQVSAAMASCAMGGDMGSMSMSMPSGTPCEGCDTPLNNPKDQISSVCATHCAIGDQPAAVSAALSVQAMEQPVFLVLPRLVPRARPTGLDAPPSGAPPRRILLHSFLI